MTREISGRRMIDVDTLQRELSVVAVAHYFGVPLPAAFGESGEQRLACPCTACSGHTDQRSVSINLSDPFKRWKCHRDGNYGCGAKGNFLTLAYCWKQGAMPAGGKPTGREFVALAEDFERIAGGEPPLAAPAIEKSVTTKSNSERIASETRATKRDVTATLADEPNTPLAQSENASARGLVNLDHELVVGLQELSAAASAYARRRPFLLSEALAHECRCGYMPANTTSSLRGKWVFGVFDDQKQPLAWVGRNVRYEEEHSIWESQGRRGAEPVKYRFPSQTYFRRGWELYGQEFLSDPRFAESLAQYGLIVVEGFTDRLRLHAAGVMSVALLSNTITAHQTERLAEYAEQYASGRVALMFDQDAAGEEGAKEVLWKLHTAGIPATLVWHRQQTAYRDRQPESLSDDELVTIFGEYAARSAR